MLDALPIGLCCVVARFLAKADGIMAGTEVAEHVFHKVHDHCTFDSGCNIFAVFFFFPIGFAALHRCLKVVLVHYCLQVDSSLKVAWECKDGDAVTRGTYFGSVSGSARSIIIGQLHVHTIHAFGLYSHCI